jgi:hypothetical protein
VACKILEHLPSVPTIPISFLRDKKKAIDCKTNEKEKPRPCMALAQTWQTRQNPPVFFPFRIHDNVFVLAVLRAFTH